MMVRDPLETRQFEVDYNRLMSLPGHGPTAGCASAPRACEVKIDRLKRRLGDATSKLLTITTAAADAETEHSHDMSQVPASITQLALLSDDFNII